jgi:type IV secretory pathway VirB10-like protein
MNAVRGAIIVVIALVIGVVVLARGLDEPDTGNAPVETTDTTVATTTTSTPAPPPADPEPPTPTGSQPASTDSAPPAPPTPPEAPTEGIPPASPDDMIAGSAPAPSPTHNRHEVRVLVSNGSGECGAAGGLATSLSAQGFNVLPAVNADNPADTSAIYYVEQYGADASVVASLLAGVDTSQVLPMPSSPPTDPGDAHVLIHIGRDDLAQATC